MRVVRGIVVAFGCCAAAFVTLAAVTSGCGRFSDAECSDTVPCLDGLVCSASGVCLVDVDLLDPVDAAVPDAPVPDAPVPDAPLPDAAPSCAHALCLEGVALDPACDPCVTAICAPFADPSCCTSDWDDVCVNQVEIFCGALDCDACGDSSCGPGESCVLCPGDCGACP